MSFCHLHANKMLFVSYYFAFSKPKPFSCYCDFMFLYRRYPNLVTSLQYKELKMILWDHQHSSLKFRTLKNDFIILAVENSLELEREMTNRFAEGIDSSLLSLQEVPGFSYLGMFAGHNEFHG